MTNGFAHVRVGHGGFHHPRRSSPSCNTGGFYQHPTNGATFDCSKPLDIVWDTTCLNSSAIDIYLYAPGANKPLVHMWETVDNAKGSYNATIDPKWWNSTSPRTLQLSIVASGSPPFLSPFPAGPVFTANYNGSASPASANSPSDSGITQVNNMGALQKSLAPGRAAAAVIIPLLVIAALITMYIRHSRAKGKEQRKRFSQAIDKRMSTISTDWKSMSGAGANAAIRNSIAVSGNRASSFSFGAIRPASTFADGGQAGVGARGLYSHENTNIDPPVMSQLRPGLRPAAFGERVSRVSFAADLPRPSVESRRNVPSRAFHNAFIPPIPNLQRQNSDDDTQATGTLSPTQTQGPLTLTPEDIRARIAGQNHNENSSVDEVMPALSMMRTGGGGTTSGEDNDYLFSASPMQQPALPQPPIPVHAKSPVGMMPMQPMPANVMSPDEMLRAYAERRPATGGSTVSYPAPAVNYNGSGMRTLYSPTTTTASVPMIQAGATHGQDFGGGQQQRVSHAGSIGSQYSDSEGYDAYVGTAK